MADVPLERSTLSSASLELSSTPDVPTPARFLEALGAAKRAPVVDLGEQVAMMLQPWAARYPQIRQIRILPLALSLAAATPWTTAEDLATTARVSLWVFTVDDFIDEGGLPLTELHRHADHFHAIARGHAPPPEDAGLAGALSDIRRGLTRFPLFTLLEERWVRALQATVQGMLREIEWNAAYRDRGASALPTFPEYRANGRFSIGGPPHIWATLIAIGDSTAIAHLDWLEHLERLASTCIRLANDIRSFDREVREGKLNGITLLSQPYVRGGDNAENARHLAETQIHDKIERGLAALARFKAEARTRTGRPEAAIADIARFVCAYYTHHDYHTFGNDSISTTNEPLAGGSEDHHDNGIEPVDRRESH